MKKYENYKDSGLEWLGMVPEHWEIMRLKSCSSIILGKMLMSIPPKGQEANYSLEKYLKSKNVGWLNLCLDDNAVEEMFFNETEKELYKLREGDIVMNEGGDIGKVALWHDTGYDCYIQNSINKITSSNGVIPAFLTYYLYSVSMSGYFWSIVSQISIAHLTKEKLANTPIILPPLTEQRTIASYLDRKVGQIDALISGKEKMVEDLKAYRSSLITETVTKGLDKEVEMKDSGVEWIGKMPSKWTVSKLKYICKINGRIGFRGYTTDDLVSEGNGAFTIGGKHISKNLLDLSSPEYISWEKYYESPEIMVKKGDIVSAQRGTLGRTAYIDKEIGPATINPSLVLINDIIEDAKFLYWFMVSNSFLSMIEFVNTATAVPMISQTQFGNTLIPLPPISEQHIIVEYLEKEISKIDTSISEIEHQLSDLKSYKSSLITEAVTGKIDLRD